MRKYRFEATIQSAGGNGAYILFPYDTQKEFGSRAKIPVNASFDGVRYKGSLIKYGDPLHMLPILRSIREQIGKGPGETVDVVIVRDISVRTVDIPTDLDKAMNCAKIRPTFDKLSYTHREEYCRWITEARREQTRQTRVTKTIEMLVQGIKSPG
jgi:hypothetical protein